MEASTGGSPDIVNVAQLDVVGVFLCWHFSGAHRNRSRGFWHTTAPFQLLSAFPLHLGHYRELSSVGWDFQWMVGAWTMALPEGPLRMWGLLKYRFLYEGYQTY